VLNSPQNSADPIVCPCLDISESEILAAGKFAGCRNIADIKTATKAGSGCTSCHRRILALLRESHRESRIETVGATEEA